MAPPRINRFQKRALLANGAPGALDAGRVYVATKPAKPPTGHARMTEELLARLHHRAPAIWRRVQGPARLALMAVVVFVLARNLGAIGWGKLVRNLPTNPWFYGVFLVNYCSLPFYETIIYNWLWRTGFSVVPALLRKRVYNEAVLEYSGESALFMWARDHTGIGDGELARNIRDVNILSTVAGNAVVLALLVGVISSVTGRLGAGDAALLRRGTLFVGGFLLVLVVLIAVFRKRFLALPFGRAAGISGLHLLRLFTYMALLSVQWHLAVPQAAWKTWIIFIALQMAVSRLPLIPAKDLFFTGLAVQLGARISANPAMLAGLFVASSGLNLIVHGVMYAIGHLAGLEAPKTLPIPAPPGPDAA